METIQFALSLTETIEIDDFGDIVYHSPSAYLSLHLRAVHIRALIRCLEKNLPELEKGDRIEQDYNLINGTGNLMKHPMPR